jgi:hypothetical protein
MYASLGSCFFQLIPTIKSIRPFDRVLCFSWLGAGRQYPNNALGCVPARLEMDSYQKGAVAHVKQSYF